MAGPTVESGAQVLMVEAEGVGSAGGIVPRACSDVLQALQVRRARGVMATLRISYVEIYGENVTDLLNENATVGQWQGVAHRAVFGGLVGVEVKDAQHLQELLLRGDSAKRRAATAMNQRSSRAHCLLMLSLTQVRADTAAEVESFLAMADLGGSEQVLKSQVASLSVQAGGFLQADTRLKEAVNINLGLLALKTCIRHLVDRSPYVPYQNSRLTMMMSKCLDSDCRTAVVVTGSSERRNALETMLTLRFGEECSQVVQTQGSSMTAAARGIKALDVEIANLEETIQRKERWETVCVCVCVCVCKCKEGWVVGSWCHCTIPTTATTLLAHEPMTGSMYLLVSAFVHSSQPQILEKSECHLVRDKHSWVIEYCIGLTRPTPRANAAPMICPH